MKGYKGFDSNLCCRGFQYEVGKTYEMEELPIVCKQGFHFALGFSTVEKYYPLIDYCELYGDNTIYHRRAMPYFSGNRYCEIEAIGEIDEEAFAAIPKLATNKIRIVRELSKEEIYYKIWHYLRYRYTEKEIEIIEEALIGKSEVKG